MKFQKGQSGNPTGRPKGTAKKPIRDMILERTNDGQELVEMMLFLAKGKDVRTVEGVLVESNQVGVKERISALEWLGAYAFGKPVEHVEVKGEVELIAALREGRERVIAGVSSRN